MLLVFAVYMRSHNEMMMSISTQIISVQAFIGLIASACLLVISGMFPVFLRKKVLVFFYSGFSFLLAILLCLLLLSHKMSLLDTAVFIDDCHSRLGILEQCLSLASLHFLVYSVNI